MEKKSGTQNKSDEKPVKKTIADSDKAETKHDYKTLIIHGENYKTVFTKKYETRKKWEKPNEKFIYSYIPGTVDEIFVHEGDMVKKGEKLLKLEAMKMLNTIEAPMDGKIYKINVKKSNKIPKGFIMIEFE